MERAAARPETRDRQNLFATLVQSVKAHSLAGSATLYDVPPQHAGLPGFHGREVARLGRDAHHPRIPWRTPMAEPGNESSGLRFFAELRRRRVIRIAVVYAIAGWVEIEVASTMLPGLNLPGWTVTLVIALVVLGFPITFLMAWMFDIGPRGIERTEPAVAPANAPAAAAFAPASVSAPVPVAPEPVPRTPQPVRAPPIMEDGRRTIAVLPFVNMSGQAD